MEELKCPKCGSVFTVNEADYASIVSQVKTDEFHREIERRLSELNEKHAAETELEKSKVEQKFQSELGKKEQELARKDAEIDHVRTEQMAEIARLKAEIANMDSLKKSEVALAKVDKDKEISDLKAQLKEYEAAKQIAIMQEKERASAVLQEKERKIEQLQSEAKLHSQEAQLNEVALKKKHSDDMQRMQEMVDYYKDMKAKLSTKMVGETLEQHCATQFGQFLRPIMPTAYFEKDNDASDGTKGDFIFRDLADGLEYVSIMFEMKNEMDETATKHKNEDFLKKLDDDRRKKNCEYAVLVSLLEPDSELYNGGIVDMSHRFEKMYVIRPQFFIPLITLLVQTSKKSLDYKRQLIAAQSKEVDVTNFENKIEDFRSKFMRHYELHSKKFTSAIESIDATIKKLQKVKEELQSSENNLRLANQDTEDLTIRRLTYKNPTMKAKFDEARELSKG